MGFYTPTSAAGAPGHQPTFYILCLDWLRNSMDPFDGPLFVGPACTVTPGGYSLFPLRRYVPPPGVPPSSRDPHHPPGVPEPSWCWNSELEVSARSPGPP